MWEAVQFLIPPLFACTIILTLLGYLGMHVLKREIIFIDIALAQIAAVGATFAHVFFHSEADSLLAYGTAFAFTVLASLFFAQIGKRITQISHEAIIGVSYAIAAAGALFIISLDAGGEVHIEHMLTGSILWAQWPDILLCAGILLLVGVFHFLYRKKFISLSEAYAEKLTPKRAAFWDFLFYSSMGLVITVSVKLAGVLVIFSFLIIPATFSALFAIGWSKRLKIAWAIGLFSIICGLAFSYSLDFSCGPSVVSFLGLSLIIGGIASKIKKQTQIN
ncbi:hypothetical protein BVY01_01255 [bacterium I07]|nr:hypothetical protein BVY01_01255 [bacterium I07]